MRIEEADKNFVVDSKIDKPDIVWLSPKDDPMSIHGLWNPKETTDCYLRMPKETADAVNDGIGYLNTHTSGGRIRFKTNSPYIALKAVMPENGTRSHMARTGQSGFDLYRLIEGKTKYYNTFIPHSAGVEAVVDTDGVMRTYTIHMPLYDSVNEVYIGLAENAELLPADPYTYEKPVLYYGSSITQGGCASRPGTSYTALIAQKYDTDFINLGFSGRARGEQNMAEYLASLDVSIFVCDYDHNAPNPEHLRATHEPLYRTYRAKNPDTPIIFVTRTDCHLPCTEERKQIIRETYEKALAEGDKNVYFIDGSTIFDCEFGDNCTVDRIHPTDFGFVRMATCIGEKVGELLEKTR